VSARGHSARPVPLARLLAMTYRHMIDGLHERLAAHGYDDVRPAFGYVLLATRERPRTGAEIGELLGTTKQAASKLIDAMEAAGYVAREAHEDDARAKTIVLTARGRRLLTTVESIYDELEAEWAKVTSKRRVDALREDLRAVLESAHGGSLPPVRPTS
jgi:DNA-binding MarR family transcriptional regulator